MFDEKNISMSDNFVKTHHLDLLAGDDIDEVIHRAIRIAKIEDKVVFFQFNGVDVTVVANSSHGLIYRDMRRAMLGCTPDSKVGPHPPYILDSSTLKNDAKIQFQKEKHIVAPKNDHEYDSLVKKLDDILNLIGEDETHPLVEIASIMDELIEAYDEKHHPMPNVNSVDALKFLMTEHKLTQQDLPDIGAQSVISEILSGKREINKRQAISLSKRFHLPVTVFLN